MIRLICLHPIVSTILLGDPYIYRAGLRRSAAASFPLESRQSIHCWTLRPFSTEFGLGNFFDFSEDELGRFR